jgi:ribosome biogenesis GTPase A
MPSWIIQWYPGHIAKARQQLQEQLQRVDVVLEVLDARIPLASRHPELGQWIQNKPSLLLLNRADAISPEKVKAWCAWFKQQGLLVYPTNGQSGEGIQQVRAAALKLGAQVNERRKGRGLLPRPVRAAVVGFPNVGKSAILNRLVGQRMVDSAAKPGVTRQLRWVRIGSDLDLLDSPGIIPPFLDNQTAAAKLAICDDIGQAAYTVERVALALLQLLGETQAKQILENRYGLKVNETIPFWIPQLAESKFHGSEERAARQILQDYRKGYWGTLGLEDPPQ